MLDHEKSDGTQAAAKAEGELNVITLPRDWCNYGEIMDNFVPEPRSTQRGPRGHQVPMG